MRAFHFYIDDWLSSKHVRRMDAYEERGYLRLLLYAASEPDCGLPVDQDELADISLLGPQWFAPTKELSKRFRNQTSGEKLLACFFEKDGRYYNTRLIREFEYQQAANLQRSEAGKKSGEARRRKSDENERPLNERSSPVGSPFEREGQRNTNNDVCVCVSDSVFVSSNSSDEECKQNAREETKTLSLVPAPLQKLFEAWWDGWSKVRGSNHRIQAAQAWLSIVTEANAEHVFACTASYLASVDGPRGYNPENFLFEQSLDGFQARWPPARASPAEEKKQQDREKFRRRMAEELAERRMSG